MQRECAGSAFRYGQDGSKADHMSIGVFDSGVGGLSVHRALVERFPTADFVYLADQANAPSAIALRRLQQTWLPGYRRETGRALNVLGIIVPTIEAAAGLPWEHEADRRDEQVQKVDILGVFSTPGTASSRVFEIEIDKRKQDLAVFSEPCPNLARMIEDGADRDTLKAEIEGHALALKRRIGRFPDRAVLGCTHYEIVADLFREALPEGTPLIHQPDSTADALERYFARHPEYVSGGSGERRFLTTGAPGEQNGLVAAFWGAPLRFEAA